LAELTSVEFIGLTAHVNLNQLTEGANIQPSLRLNSPRTKLHLCRLMFLQQSESTDLKDMFNPYNWVLNLPVFINVFDQFILRIFYLQLYERE